MSTRARLAGSTLLVLVSFVLFALPADAKDLDCLECHDDVEFTSTAHPDVTCGECHTNVTSMRHKRGVEPLTDETSCGECHSSVLRALGRSAHGGEAACADCHGAPHDIRPADDLASAVSPVNQIKYCGGCHNEPPALIEGYLAGEHGKALLLSGLISAPACSDCHGDHRIMKVDSSRAPTEHHNSPEMCGACHQMLFDDWTNHSAHGKAWQEDAEGPVCVDCHASHEIVDPTTYDARHASARNCGSCHEEYLTTFRDSFHGKGLHLGLSGGASCADCHTPHAQMSADHPESSIHPDNRLATCGKCHEDITPSFATFEPHNDPTDPDDNFKVYVVYMFMTGLLIGVFAFFGLHDILWLQRSLVGVMRGEFEEERRAASGQWVRRFRLKHIRTHVIVITTFILLALTGLPLKFAHTAPWAQTLVDVLGGVDSTRFIHRLAAVGTFGYLLFHVVDVLWRTVVRREKGMFWGPNSMMPQPKDLWDLLGNIRYFLYLGERPKGDRWTYFEKFDYLAVFWGVAMIGVSGLFLWYPDVVTQVMPGWTLNVAQVIHSDEALLATGFIFFFHFFHTHLRPESFPMDLVVFLGKMPLERFKSERPLEYERAVENGELETLMVEAPSTREIREAYIFGSIYLVIGIMLAIFIVWALLTH
jgi:cytochrome b subunit of formate dehydrogenase